MIFQKYMLEKKPFKQVRQLFERLSLMHDKLLYHLLAHP